MPLIDLWKSNPAAVTKMSIEQIVGIAGDGKLTDDSPCSTELRQFLGEVDTGRLAAFARHCLDQSWNKSGMVLQDVVNELGRRLEFTVTGGRYQGAIGGIGFDGIWRDPQGPSLVIEVKTTDAYRIKLDTIAAYRDKLMEQNPAAAFGPALIIVGRQDTGELESQIRGSRHAWDFRLVSVDALISLVELKENGDSGLTAAKLRSALMPVEYTRLDRLIELMFTAAKDVEAAVEAEKPETDDSQQSSWEFTPPAIINEKRSAILESLAAEAGTSLIRRSRALYWSPDHRYRAVCTLSKRYEKSNTLYWFAYHPAWAEFLAGGETGVLVLGGVDLDVAFRIPVERMRQVLPDLNTSPNKKGGEYWHVKIVEPSPGRYALQLPLSGKVLALDEFRIPVGQIIRGEGS